uniref:Uncharacterized protein n=1 Tax=Branchiostoma floridae TaxID=7739 RepID=C3ZMD2_BRAFL|eukprot:XP_002590377.1 hypothetical protein BRAFLDRAFT_76650 [Branchiostoma floridae]
MVVIFFIILVAPSLGRADDVSNSNKDNQHDHNDRKEQASDARIDVLLSILENVSAFYEKTPKPDFPEDGDPLGAYDPMRASAEIGEDKDEKVAKPDTKIETVVRQRRRLY